MGRIFGTDGVRGAAGVELTAQLALDLAVAAVPVLAPAAAASGQKKKKEKQQEKNEIISKKTKKIKK